MTPLIQEMVALSPEEAANFHWFDMTEVYRPEQKIDGEVLGRPLPFPFTALVCAYEDRKIMLLVRCFQGITAVAGWQWEGKRYGKTLAFTYVVEGDSVRVRHEDGSKFDYRDSPTVGVIAFIAAFLESLDVRPATGHLPVKRDNWAKKIRQGKVPTYDWKTVVIEPTKLKGEDKGGTHAAPRWHERRGHWRTTKLGKKIWVRNCEVGDKTRGAVFHDYRIKAQGEKNE